jgi:hypothetical protein
MRLANFLLIALALGISALRFAVRTVGHSWPMVFIALAHVYVGMLLLALYQEHRWRWLTSMGGLVSLLDDLRFWCLFVPTAIETALFFMARG